MYVYVQVVNYVFLTHSWGNFSSVETIVHKTPTFLCRVPLQAEGLWMSSSKEILLFRRILLNPVTCTQFQHFVSLKGEFLENDVLFWLEVQRYKVKKKPKDILRSTCWWVACCTCNLCSKPFCKEITPLLNLFIINLFGSLNWYTEIVLYDDIGDILCPVV